MFLVLNEGFYFLLIFPIFIFNFSLIINDGGHLSSYISVHNICKHWVYEVLLHLIEYKPGDGQHLVDSHPIIFFKLSIFFFNKLN